jgi:hypothetical protein
MIADATPMNADEMRESDKWMLKERLYTQRH